MLHGLLIAGVNGEKVQAVLPEACSQGPEHPRGVFLVCEEDQLGLRHGCSKSAVNGAATDACHNIWEACRGKALKLLHCDVTCVNTCSREAVKHLQPSVRYKSQIVSIVLQLMQCITEVWEACCCSGPHVAVMSLKHRQTSAESMWACWINAAGATAVTAAACIIWQSSCHACLLHSRDSPFSPKHYVDCVEQDFSMTVFPCSPK